MATIQRVMKAMPKRAKTPQAEERISPTL